MSFFRVTYRVTSRDHLYYIVLLYYQRYTFSMYSGDVQRVTMRFRNNMMNAVMDKFGKLGYVKEVDKDHLEVTVSVAVSPQFFGWFFGLGNYVTIVGPEDVKEKMKKMLDKPCDNNYM